MNRQSKFLLLFLNSFLFLFFPPSILAQDVFKPLNDTIECFNTADPEFHSLRPYQANIKCTENLSSNYANFCGNDLTITEKITVKYNEADSCTDDSSGKMKCEYDVKVEPHNLTINLEGADLPIMGNTEDVSNSQSSEDSLSDVKKVNEYVSWYLNGIINRAEYGSAKNTDLDVVNFSGPIQKLYPSAVLEARRIETIKNAKKTNHNQIVACATTGSSIGDLLNIGHLEVTECYDGDGKEAKGEIFRLNAEPNTFLDNTPIISNILDVFGANAYGWNGEISWVRSITNLIPGGMKFILDSLAEMLPPSIAKYVTQDIIDNSISTAWNKAIPPLPWNFESDLMYRKAYNEWHGKTCIVIPVISHLVCMDNIIIPNKYADFFTNVPLSSTEDVEGNIRVDEVSSAENPEVDGITVSNIKFEDQQPATLFYSHLLESNQLGSILQDTYIPKDSDKVGDPTDIASDDYCKSLEVRSNEGDDLFASKIIGNLSYTAKFSCLFEPKDESVVTGDECAKKNDDSGECVPQSWECFMEYGSTGCSNGYKCGVACTQSCSKDIDIHLSTESKTPEIDDIWSRLVAGPTSVFKRIFPKLNTEGSFGQLIDIPGSTDITYSSENVAVSQATTDLKLPHVGGISEYFLKGIQTALRPKGYGENITFADGSTTNSCVNGILPALPSGQECTLSNSKGLPITETYQKILEAAGKTYNVPPSLILGLLYGEGTFNDEGKWTEENVLDWATCGKMPGCSGPETSIGHVISAWDSTAKKILPDLQKLDPSKTEVDPCNLLDVTYALAKIIHDNAGGSPALTGKKCLNITMSSTIPTSCNWNDSQYETAIRVWEFGTAWGNTANGFLTCATQKNGCLLGGLNAQCATDTLTKTDTCDISSAANSHNRCVWDVAHGN